mmetsp:Transcript_31062/g.58474  ORF Transcript_31062/g.58474 Transcript_31062/m.58474 type:complete len:406 (-) Transcript_31062:198-1415(-)
MVTLLIHHAQDVEQEEVHVVVQSLVIQEQLGQVAEVLTVHFFLLAVHFEERDVALPVYLVPRRMTQLALLEVSLQLLLAAHEAEAELAEIQLVARGHLRGERREVPRLHVKLANLDPVDVLHLGELLVLAQARRIKLLVPVIRRHLRVDLALLVARAVARGVAAARLVHGNHRGQVQLAQLDPLVQSPIELNVVNVVLVVRLRLNLTPFDDSDLMPLVVAPLAVDLRPNVKWQHDFALRLRLARLRSGAIHIRFCVQSCVCIRLRLHINICLLSQISSCATRSPHLAFSFSFPLPLRAFTLPTLPATIYSVFVHILQLRLCILRCYSIWLLNDCTSSMIISIGCSPRIAVRRTVGCHSYIKDPSSCSHLVRAGKLQVDKSNIPDSQHASNKTGIILNSELLNTRR